MIININPNRINNPGARPTAKAAERKRQQSSIIEAPQVAPKRAHINFIPSPESLATLVGSAIAALRKGVRWDRGTILNLLV